MSEKLANLEKKGGSGSTTVVPNWAGLEIPEGKYITLSDGVLHDIPSSLTIKNTSAVILNCATISRIQRTTGNGQTVLGLTAGGSRGLSGNDTTNVYQNFVFIRCETTSSSGYTWTITQR